MRIFIKIFIGVFLLLLVAISAGLYFYWQEINQANNISTEKSIVINDGDSLEVIGQSLMENGLIENDLWFNIYVRQNKWDKKIKAGEYKFNSSQSLRQVARSIVTGEAINREAKVLVKEGLTSKEIAGIFQDSGMFTADEFLGVAGYPMVDYRIAQNYPTLVDYSSKYLFLSDKPSYLGLEGYLFPDTYRFFKDSTPQGVVLKMLDNFDKKLTPQMRQAIKAQGKTIFEIVTMASLIEKEVKSQADMKIVSGIFWNRIKNSQRLESCASLAYILGENKAQYTLEDTNTQSPYNTYRNDGLPPGPISNPGIKAITAAIYPADTQYNYFLTATDGQTVFAKTFDEHIENKAKYLK